MKSVCGSGRKLIFCCPRMKPRPITPPVPTAISDWMIWKPSPSGSFQGSSQLWMRLMRYSCVMTSAMNAGTNATTRPTR